MTDFAWPDDLKPYSVSFYLQPHTGGTESPFSRKTKTYELSAPRWICRLTLRGGDNEKWGNGSFAKYGPRLDAFIAKLKGRANRVSLHDFRRPRMRTIDWPNSPSNLAAALGATTITITGLSPFSRIHAGDYIGGDGRPHIITDDADANGSGSAVVSFQPPLVAAVGAGAAVFGNPTGLFRLTSDDAGQNASEVGQLTHYDLEFVEDL